MSHLIDVLNRADVVRVDGGPLLTGFDQDNEDGSVVFRWTDDEGTVEEWLGLDEVAGAEVMRNGFVVSRADGDKTRIEVFSLVPNYPVPESLSDDWINLFNQSDKEKVVPLDVIQAVMDNLVDHVIGGNTGCATNNKGFLGQIEALYEALDGRKYDLVDELARRLSRCSGYPQKAWKAVLNAPFSAARSLVRDLQAVSGS